MLQLIALLGAFRAFPARAGWALPRISFMARSMDAAVIFDKERFGQASGGDEAFARLLLDTYFTTVPVRLRQMRAAFRKGDLKTLQYRAHAVSDSSQAVGAERIAALCVALEEGHEAGPILAQLPQELREFSAAVQALV